MSDKDMQLATLMRALTDLSARVARLERMEPGAGSSGRIAAGSVTLQPSLSIGDWLYTNTQITHSAGVTDYMVMLAVEDAPALAWVTDCTATTCVIWVALDKRLTEQAATPTVRYLVLR